MQFGHSEICVVLVCLIFRSRWRNFSEELNLMSLNVAYTHNCFFSSWILRGNVVVLQTVPAFGGVLFINIERSCIFPFIKRGKKKKKEKQWTYPEATYTGLEMYLKPSKLERLTR